MAFEDRRVLTTFNFVFLRELEAAYRRFLGNELHSIIDAQQGFNPGPMPGYLVGDRAYYFSSTGAPLVTTLQYLPGGILPKSLSPLLTERHEQWIKHYEQHDRDFPRIRQALGSLVIRAKEPQDLRDMFPEHVIRPACTHELLSGLTRSRPDLYPGPKDSDQYDREMQRRELYWDRTMINMYEAVGPLVDTYLGYKFLA